MAARKLTLKEQRFVDAYLADANGNATEAALSAGYTRNRGSAKTLGARLLTKVHLSRAIKARTARAEKLSILTADERDEWLSRIVRSQASEKDKIAAIKELNKVSGRHSVNISMSGKVTLEQILGESRK